MRFDIVTIFPGFFAGFFEHGIVRRAQAEGLVSVAVHDLRNFTHDRHRTVDDRPFGGGEGMVLKPEPLAEALEALGIRPRTSVPADDAGAKAPTISGPSSARLKSCPDAADVMKRCPDAADVMKSCPDAADVMKSGPNAADVMKPCADEGDVMKSCPDAADVMKPCADAACVILLSAQGKPFTQAMARELARLERVVLICGRYEGVDERINELYCDFELSIGDYVLSGGELAAAVVLDATMRLVPGVLGNEASGEFESFGAADAAIDTDVEGVPRSQHGAGGLLDYPHYTRPAEFRGLRAPEVLLNGDHRQIRQWRRQQQLRKTLQNRPDLLEKAELTEAERRLISEWGKTREK